MAYNLAYKTEWNDNIWRAADRDLHQFPMIDNYIYLYHVDKYIILPEYPEDINDTTSISYPPTTPLSRSAPIYSFQSSGPRSVQARFILHREMMNQINYNNASVKQGVNDDYIDILINYLQAATLPSYSTSSKMVNPPIVALRLGRDVFIKGVISNSLGLTYKVPILKNGKYAVVEFTLNINEVDPYDAKMVMEMGSYRSTAKGNLNLTLEKGFY